MIQKYYTEKLVAQALEVGAGNLTARVSWIVINGAGQTVKAETQHSGIIATDLSDIADFGDGSTAISDPDRMRKFIEVTIYNSDTANTRSVQIRVGLTPSGTVPVTGYMQVPGGGCIQYADGVWNILNDKGRLIGGGSYNPGGF